VTVTLGLDVFSGNGHVNFAKARAEDGIAFAVRKATQGVTYNDHGFVDDWNAICSAGLMPGAYHFAHNAANTAQAEAAHFLSILGSRRGLIALDLEDTHDGRTLTQRATWAATWLSLVASGTGLRPLLYTYRSWWLSGPFTALRGMYAGWIPLDPVTPGEVTQTARVIGTLGTLDVDTFDGTLDDLRRLAGLTVAIPAPQPAPVPVSHNFTKDDDDMARLFVCTDPKVDPRLGVISAAFGPRWVKSGTERDYLIAAKLVENDLGSLDKKTSAEMAALLGTLA